MLCLPVIVVFTGIACATCGFAQQTPPAFEQSEGKAQFQNPQVSKNTGAPCVEPPPIIRLEDYEGPMKKAVGFFARALERKAVPHYKPGVFLCSLAAKDKFVLFVQDSLNPVAFLSSGFNAGLDQASNRDPAFGQGMAGYAKRFAANTAGQASAKFFKDFAFPSIFSEDPRYYRIARGSFGKRLLNAMSHSFVAYREDGTHVFNSSEWLGTTSAVVLSNAYHPDKERGVGPAARNVGLAVLQDMGFDVLREFWPEVSRKLNLPFRGSHETDSSTKAADNN
jgi:hypothetical protein